MLALRLCDFGKLWKPCSSPTIASPDSTTPCPRGVSCSSSESWAAIAAPALRAVLGRGLTVLGWTVPCPRGGGGCAARLACGWPGGSSRLRPALPHLSRSWRVWSNSSRVISPYRFPPSQTTKGMLITTPGCLIVSSPAPAASRTSTAVFNSRAWVSSVQVTMFKRRRGV